ncbi:MAG: alpha/beta fold hydrolase [Candidatus Paceibacterota bacterium]|jgi:hypothetical protein
MIIKKQVIVIHGGDTFETREEYLAFLKSYQIKSLDYFKGKDWKKTLQERLGEDFEVIVPAMPCKINARYEEWKIWFEKIIPLLNDEVILIGHSMGGTFLAKYLTENNFPKKVLSLHLVAAPYDTEVIKESLVDFALNKTVEGLAQYTDKIFLYQSKEDKVVALEDAMKYKRDLPNAEINIFEGRGHFKQEEFPELVERIKRT